MSSGDDLSGYHLKIHCVYIVSLNLPKPWVVPEAVFTLQVEESRSLPRPCICSRLPLSVAWPHSALSFPHRYGGPVGGQPLTSSLGRISSRVEVQLGALCLRLFKYSRLQF